MMETTYNNLTLARQIIARERKKCRQKPMCRHTKCFWYNNPLHQRAYGILENSDVHSLYKLSEKAPGVKPRYTQKHFMTTILKAKKWYCWVLRA